MTLFSLAPGYPACPAGWVSISPALGCVLLHSAGCATNTGCSWLQATESCQALGGHLVEIQGQTEQRFLAQLARLAQVISKSEM